MELAADYSCGPYLFDRIEGGVDGCTRGKWDVRVRIGVKKGVALRVPYCLVYVLLRRYSDDPGLVEFTMTEHV